MSSPEYNEEYEDYASLADEMNDYDPKTGEPQVWVEADWDDRAVANGKKYANAHGLPWPPGLGDYDRLYEREHA